MQNPIPRFRQSYIISKKPFWKFYLKNWNLWRAPTTIELNIFCWNFAHASYLTMTREGCSEFFNLVRSWVDNQNGKNLASVSM